MNREPRFSTEAVAAASPKPTHIEAFEANTLSDIPFAFSHNCAGLIHGLPAAQGRPKGGRRHQHLTLAQAQSLLAPLHAQAKAGQLVTAHTIKTRYETRVGRAVPASTVYRLLGRHQWRQIQPRPKHPKDNPRARAAFKKTPDQSDRRGGWTPAPAVTADV